VSTTPPATPPDPNVLHQMATWLGQVLTDAIALLADAEAGPVLLAEHGWTAVAPAIPAQLLARVPPPSWQSGQSPPSTSGETFTEVLIAVAALAEAFATVPSAPGSAAVSALEVVADILDTVVLLRLRADHPKLWAWLRLLTLVDDDAAQLAALSDLLGDTEKYLSGLVIGPSYEQRMQDWSAVLLGGAGLGVAMLPPIPRHGSHDPHGPDQTSFRSEALYGWSPASAQDHPNLMTVLGRLLTWRLDAQVASTTSTPAAEQTADLTVALVPRQHNAGIPGFFARIAGATSVTIPLGKPPASSTDPPGWQFTLSSTDGGALYILMAQNGFVRGESDGFKLSAALERPPSLSGSWLWGDSKDTHVEVQHARIATTISLDGQGVLGDFSAGADHVILNIQLGGDGLMNSVLPPSLRLDSQLGIGYDTRRGAYLNGGTGLVADLPINVSLGPSDVLALKIMGLHLRIALADVPPPGAPSSSPASDTQFAVSVTLDAAVSIASGRVTLIVGGTGASWSITQLSSGGDAGAGAIGHWQPELNAVAPSGVGVQIHGDVITGGGYFGRDPITHTYTGAGQVALEVGEYVLALEILGTFDTALPADTGWALLVILGVRFVPGIPLPFGLSLTAVGGAFAHNHSVDVDAIAAGLRTKALDAILFPPNPVAQAPHIFAVWRQTLPLAADHTVGGLGAQISWSDSSKFGAFEFMLLIDWGNGPTQYVLLGQLAISFPTDSHKIIRIEADLVGRMTLDPLDLFIEAELVDSKIGKVALSGGLLVAYRRDTYAIVSIGGYHPHFTPPADLPVPQRLRADLSSGSSLRLRAELYLAITPGTFQFGARAQLHASAGPVAVDGWLGFDLLIESGPRFDTEITAGVSLSVGGTVLAEVSLDLTFTGPGPWHAVGTASFSILFFSVSLPIDHTWGDSAPPLSPTGQPLELVRTALSRADAWGASLPAGVSPVVTLRPPAGAAATAHPLAEVTCRQTLVPLGLTITRVAGQPLGTPTMVDITGLTIGGTHPGDSAPATEMFAAPQFLTLTDDQALSRPSFEPMRAGLAAGGQTVDDGAAAVVATTYKTVTVDGASATPGSDWPLDPTHATAVLNPPGPTLARPLPLQLSVLPDTLRSATGHAPETAALAIQGAAGARVFDLVGVAGGAR
jgi:hypothetical protein